MNRTRAQDSDNQAEILASAVLSASPDWISVVFADGFIRFMNPAGRTAIGTDAQSSLEAFEFPDLWPEDRVQPIRDAIRKAANGGTVHIETPCIAKGDSSRSWSLRFVALASLDGEPARVLVTGREMPPVDTAKSAEVRLQHALSNSQVIGLWEWDVRADRVVANERFAKLYSVDVADAAAGAPVERFIDGIHADDRTRVGAEIETAMRSGDEFSSEYRLQSKTLGTRHVHARGRCTQDASGQPLLFSGVVFDVTDQRSVEGRLEDVQDRYRSLFNSIDASVCIIELEFDGSDRATGYRIMEVNEAFALQTGDGDAAGKWAGELALDDQHRGLDRYAEVLRTGVPVRFEEASQLSPDDWFEIHAFRIGDAANHQVAVLVTDISERRRTELHLQASERELRLALQAGRFGAWTLNLQTGEFVASDICKLNFGFGATDGFSYEQLRNSIHEEDRARVFAAIDHSIASGDDYDVDYRVLTPAGDLRWVSIRAQVAPEQEGSARRMSGVSLDITDRKAKERTRGALIELGNVIRNVEDPAALAYAAAEILGRTLEVSRAGYGVVDTVAETITVERDWQAPGIASLAGVLRFRDYGNYIDDLKRGETVVFADAYLDPRTAQGADGLKAISAQAAINMPVTEKDGFVALLYLNHATAREWPAEDLELVREVAELTRVAVQRRQAELDLRALALSLEHQIQVRSEALVKAEEQLRQSQKMEAVGQLTGGIAHDFNNLLTSISGSLELLKLRLDQGRYSELERYAETAQASSKRAAALTHRLLAFSRRQTLSPKPTNVSRLVSGMQELIHRTVGPSIALDSVVAAGLWNTLVDQNQLENALLNLCINARDAMPDGGQLTIETANRSLDDASSRVLDLPIGQYVSVCVSDTGTGMTKDVIERAFDPFFTTKPIGQGTGLGLSMIYGFARQSSGQVRIYSEVGKGTMVCLYLPRDLSAEEAIEPAKAAEIVVPADTRSTVLIVDDEADIRIMLVELLADLGYQTLEAEDGKSALKVLKSGARIDLLISDVGLPGGMNGRQVGDAARELIPGLQVLFITGYAENAVVSHGHLPLGMHVLTKPFSLSSFTRRVQELLPDLPAPKANPSCHVLVQPRGLNAFAASRSKR